MGEEIALAKFRYVEKEVPGCFNGFSVIPGLEVIYLDLTLIHRGGGTYAVKAFGWTSVSCNLASKLLKEGTGLAWSTHKPYLNNNYRVNDLGMNAYHQYSREIRDKRVRVVLENIANDRHFLTHLSLDEYCRWILPSTMDAVESKSEQ